MEDFPSEQSLSILRALKGRLTLEEVAKKTGIRPIELGKEVARLQRVGFIDDKGARTEKGRKALSRARLG